MGKLKNYNRYVTGGDYVEKDAAPTSIGNLYRYSDNTVVNISFDTSKVTSTSYMFQNNKSLTTCNLFDTSNVTSMNYMFDYCSKLIRVPQFDTSNVTSMSSMFNQCNVLVAVPQFDTSNVTSMSNMCSGCPKLVSVPLLDCGSISGGSSMNIFGSSSMSNLTYLGGFKNLGKVSNFSKPSYFLKNCKNLTKESVMNVINNLYDRATAGYSVVTLPFNSASLALLSDEEKAIATNKGFTLATS